ALDHAKKHANPNYVCPMHPEIVTDDPEATCPICGMDLVVLESNGEAGVVQLTQTVINALGVRTAKVKRRTIYRKINSIGYITVDEKNIRRVSLRTEGWIEKLMVNSIGGRVSKGDLLFQLYAPKLVNAQEEYVQAIELDQGDGSLIDASKARLRALGVSPAQIEELRNTKKVEQLVNIYAPQDGVVSELSVREGDFVPPSKPVVSLVDLSSVWLMADIFESRVGWVKEDQKAEATLSFMPGKTWEGTVEYVYPSLDKKTRSVKARLRFDNPGELLKPNMYANVSIFAQPKRKVLTVPREAVIRTGNQARVIVAEGEGKFKPIIIHTGIETDTKIEVVGGLDEGQEVVVSSQFLIDSESSMRAALMRLAGG
ncbi:MAG: efflux RND transporter periplasmic adaptor subunit, partial [Gammaproteobacteria bacterium]|nr:efflux RND transporter periplasmic adaptor subunit [Gammaproteobacteria bacterium]